MVLPCCCRMATMGRWVRIQLAWATPHDAQLLHAAMPAHAASIHFLQHPTQLHLVQAPSSASATCSVKHDCIPCTPAALRPAACRHIWACISKAGISELCRLSRQSSTHHIYSAYFSPLVDSLNNGRQVTQGNCRLYCSSKMIAKLINHPLCQSNSHIG